MKQLQAVQQVDRYVHERRVTDQTFVGWGIYVFLLSWITLGIYVIVMTYRRFLRADLFRERRLHYYCSVIEATRQYAEENGEGADVQEELNDLQRYVNERFEDEHKEIRPGLATFLSYITLGIYFLYATYRMMRFWWQIQVTEEDFNAKLSEIWLPLGIVHYRLTYMPIVALRRNFGTHLLLLFITIGIYGFVWDYQLHTDPEKVYPEMHSSEDAVLSALRNIETGSLRAHASA